MIIPVTQEREGINGQKAISEACLIPFRMPACGLHLSQSFGGWIFPRHCLCIYRDAPTISGEELLPTGILRLRVALTCYVVIKFKILKMN